MGEQIVTTCGKVILVDEDDYPLLSRHSWQLAGGDYASTKMPSLTTGRCYTIFLHKLVVANFGFVDHINGNKLDCRKQNLRPATRQQNGFNTRKFKTVRGKPPSSQYKGVVKCQGANGRIYWRVIAKLSEKGEIPTRFMRLGPFATEVEAANAYNEEIVKHRGEWAWLNKPVGEAA